MSIQSWRFRTTENLGQICFCLWATLQRRTTNESVLIAWCCCCTKKEASKPGRKVNSMRGGKSCDWCWDLFSSALSIPSPLSLLLWTTNLIILRWTSPFNDPFIRTLVGRSFLRLYLVRLQSGNKELFPWGSSHEEVHVCRVIDFGLARMFHLNWQNEFPRTNHTCVHTQIDNPAGNRVSQFGI